MAVYPVYIGDAYQETYVGGVHMEGYVETRAEISTYATEWGIGSFLYCAEDGSKWILGTSSGDKEWQEMTS